MSPSRTAYGRRRKQLRVAAEGVRRGQPTPPRRASDPDLLDLLHEPFADVDETHDRLRRIQSALETRGDRRAVFLSIYVRMTGAVADRVRDAAFADADWVRAYLVEFADLYRRALLDYEERRVSSLATAWRLAFDAAERGDSLVVQDAALGVNAHINYDLALALDRVGVSPDRDRKYADHHAVTAIISDILDESQVALAARDAPGLTSLDVSLGRFDEWLWVFTIDECRDSAWRTAVALESRFPPRRRFAHWFNDVTATGAAHLVLSSRVSETVHDALRGLEASADVGDGERR